MVNTAVAPDGPVKVNGSSLVVLAFSGGLDTSYCVKYFTETKGLEVHSVIVNTGGFSQTELEDIEAQAYRLGVSKHVVLDETDNYYQKCIKYLIFGNDAETSGLGVDVGFPAEPRSYGVTLGYSF